MKWSSPLPRLVFYAYHDLDERRYGWLLWPVPTFHHALHFHIYLGSYTWSLWLTWPERSKP